MFGSSKRERAENEINVLGGYANLYDSHKFANEANRELFLRDPNKYEPTYGGWCATAMATGSRIEIDATLFTIHGRRIHFFVSRMTRI